MILLGLLISNIYNRGRVYGKSWILWWSNTTSSQPYNQLSLWQADHLLHRPCCHTSAQVHGNLLKVSKSTIPQEIIIILTPKEFHRLQPTSLLPPELWCWLPSLLAAQRMVDGGQERSSNWVHTQPRHCTNMSLPHSIWLALLQLCTWDMVSRPHTSP